MMKMNLGKSGWYLFALIIVFGLFVFVTAYLVIIPALTKTHFYSLINQPLNDDTTTVCIAERTKLEKEIEALKQKNERLTPANAFLIINTTDNTFKLFKKNQVIRFGKCSTGSFIQLEIDSTKSYIFETPKGALTVKGKITNPIWKKPDWAFIEEGLPVPPPNHPSRFERNVLGDYALSLGNGYLIHGTLYQRLIGMPVTHGCVRLNDEDLEIVYNTMQLGSKVFIY